MNNYGVPFISNYLKKKAISGDEKSLRRIIRSNWYMVRHKGFETVLRKRNSLAWMIFARAVGCKINSDDIPILKYYDFSAIIEGIKTTLYEIHKEDLIKIQTDMANQWFKEWSKNNEKDL